MNAKCCDVCGALYKKPKNIPEYRVVKYGHYGGERIVDLCSGCYEKLVAFLQSGKEAEEEGSEPDVRG